MLFFFFFFFTLFKMVINGLAVEINYMIFFFKELGERERAWTTENGN